MICNPNTYGKGRKHLEKLEAKGARYELKELKVNRSNAQNRYLYLLLNYFSDHTGYTPDECKVLLKRVVLPDVFVYKKETYLFEKSTAQLTSEEMTQVIDRFRRWASEELNIYLPDANGIPDHVIMDAMENELNYGQ